MMIAQRYALDKRYKRCNYYVQRFYMPLIAHTVFTRLYASGVYFRLGIMDPAFI